MTSIRFVSAGRIALILVSWFVTLVLTSAALAQQRTFVSGLGNDANPCTRVAPCRTFNQAISLTNPAGEVLVLDSAGYGPFTIIKSISIIAPPGIYAGISVFSADGIDINAGPSDTVILRGLTVNNQGSAGNGILIQAAYNVLVERCVVNGFASADGLGYVGDGGFNALEVKDSIIRGNQIGIHLVPKAPGIVDAAIDGVRLEKSSISGLYAGDGSTVSVSNTIASFGGDGFTAGPGSSMPVRLSLDHCVASNNTGSGVSASDSSASHTVEVNMEGCVVYGNSFGVFCQSIATGVSTIRVSNSTVTDNNIGLANEGFPAMVLSRGNNTVEGNTNNTVGTIGSYTAK